MEAADDEFVQAGTAERLRRWTLKNPADLLRTRASHPPLYWSSALYHTPPLLAGFPAAGDKKKRLSFEVLDAVKIPNQAPTKRKVQTM